MFKPSFKPDPKVYTAPKVKQPMSKTPTTDRGKAEKRLDNVFSLWIRRRATVNGKVICFTCKRPGTQDNPIECGHFVKRVHHATRWDEVNCQAQCYHCNRILDGNLDVFRKRLVSLYGESEVLRLDSIRRNAEKFTEVELMEMIKKYSK